MIDICEKAIDRVRRLQDEERYLELCFKYLVCPKCGEYVEKSSTGVMESKPPLHHYLYECKDCGWKEYRTI